MSLINQVKLINVSDASYTNYKSRINTLINITGKDLKYILKHPTEMYEFLKKHYNGKYTTVSNYISVVTKIFSSNKDLADKYPISYKKWKHYLLEMKKAQHEKYQENQASDMQLEKIVTMQDIHTKYTVLKTDATTHNNLKSHYQFLLLSCFIHIVPKRADLGNIYIYTHKPMILPDDINYITLYNDKPILQINKFKTAKHMPSGLTEEIPAALLADIHTSLKRYPRSYLFTDNKGKPYTKNNSYSKFVQRSFQHLFGKSMGVSLWRHVWVSTQMDMQNMSQKELSKKIQLMGTSEHQTKNVYKWININQNQLCECYPISHMKTT